jgi:PKD repeat protein
MQGGEQRHLAVQRKDPFETKQIHGKTIISILFTVLLLSGIVMPVYAWNTPGCRESTDTMAKLHTCTPKLSPTYWQPNAHIYTIQYAIKYFRETGKSNWANYLEDNFNDLAAGITYADEYKGRVKLKFEHCIFWRAKCWRYEVEDLGPFAGYYHYYDPNKNSGLDLRWSGALDLPLQLGLSGISVSTFGIYTPRFYTEPDIVWQTYPPANKLAEDHYRNALDVWRMTPHEFALKSSTYGPMSQESATLFEAGHSLHFFQDTCFFAHLDTDNGILLLSHGKIEDLGDHRETPGDCRECHIRPTSSIPDFRKSVSELSHDAALETLHEKNDLTTIDLGMGLKTFDQETVIKKEIYRTEQYTVAFLSKLLTDMDIPPGDSITDDEIPPGPVPPSAYFTLSTISGYPPFLLTITDASTGDPTSWLWTFSGPIDVGSQPITSRTLPTYNLDQPGVVKITLTVSNQYGSSSTTRTVTVKGSAPVADFYLSPAFGTEPLDVTIYDTSIGDPATWEWTIESPDRAPEKVYQKDLPGSYEFGAGTHRVTLSVGNAYGSSSRTRTVTVLPADTAEPPVTCPDGCSCTDPDLPGVERCSDTPCGSADGRTYYCTRAIPSVTCSGDCRCLLEADAIQIFGDDNHVPQKCSTSPCESAGGVSKYCYREGTVTCPSGCRCLNPVAASYQFSRPVKCSDTICGYSGDPDTPSVRDPKYCYREGYVVS